MIKIAKVLFMIFLINFPLNLFGQGKPYEGPEDPAADISAVRIGYLNGNRVLMPFENTSTLGRGSQSLYSKWPNNYEGNQMTDNITVMIGSEVYIYQDSIPITDTTQVAFLAQQGLIDTLFFIQGNDPERNDYNYDHTVDWAMYPVPGYFNEAQDYLAQSNKPESWPPAGWPSTGFEKKWPGEWNGRFGRGVTSADLETFYVSNDAQDLEYIVRRNDPEERLINEGPRYHPRPGRFIGDINPNVTVQKGYPWGGLGLRVALRCFQWNNPEAKDMIFLEYEISNISDYDLPTSGFGIFLDTAVGGEHSPDGDVGYFDKDLDMAYAWDFDGVGVAGFTPGVIGMAFLESPGRAYDGLDNDGDGLVDEKRDNPAGQIIGATENIFDMDKFLDFYGKDISELREHYEGDEDQDWEDGVDANDNGTYAYQDALGNWYVEPGDNPNNDVGLDGVGPMDINYEGPDADGTECNHIPDFQEGVGCEPNFAATDVSESDMLGLTSFSVFDYGEWMGNNWRLMDDQTTWELMRSNIYREIYEEPNSIYFQFGSTTFPFFKGRTERISMAMLFAYEDLSGLQSAEHSAPNLKRLKDVAQIIYERDYRFTQPPLMPTLTATTGDGKVILTWDDVADKLTREPFLNRANDFEGYKVYRATDKLMSDAEVITNGQGVKMFKKPIYQCDLIDNKEGYADYGLADGTAFYLGDETGITHYFVDENVQNGRTYYYAVVAYDFGVDREDIANGISPTENTIVIELDESEDIVRIGKNVAVVTPGQAAAGYESPSASPNSELNIIGTGSVTSQILNFDEIKANHTYNVIFDVDTVTILRGGDRHHPMEVFYINTGFGIYDVTEENKLVYQENPENHTSDIIVKRQVTGVGMDDMFDCINPDRIIKTDVFDGIQLTIKEPVITATYDSTKSGWITGNSQVNVTVGALAESYFPWQYDIIFTEDSAYTTRTTSTAAIKDLALENISGSNLIMDRKFPFYVINRNSVDSSGNYEVLDLIVHDVNANGLFEPDSDYVLVGHARDLSTSRKTIIYWAGTIFTIDYFNVRNANDLPKAEDVYHVDFQRPFAETDTIKFTINPAVDVSETKLNDNMENIKVVPNPYIMTNSMEPAVSNKYLNQRRRLLFTHIPARCEIRIFTSSGVLVDKIDVENEPNNGIVHWDLLSKEDLEIAAGMYVYHIKSKVTGKEKVGKFAVIK